MGGLITLLVVGLLLAALAASAETSLTSVSRIRMRSLAEEGRSRAAATVVRLHNDPNAYLSTILAVNTVAVIVASTATAVLAQQQGFPEAIATTALAVVTLVACEIAPKSLALRFNEPLALAMARPVGFVTALLRPLVAGLTLIATLLLRLTTRGSSVPGPFVTEEELKMLVAVGEQEGVVELEERQMIQGILEMTDKAVREIMVPRVDVVALEVHRTAGDAIAAVVQHGHSRIPVFDGDLDNIVGVIYAKDLLHHGVSSDDPRPLVELARQPYLIPESKRVGELLHEMQVKTVHLAIVIDEYGGTAGIVTIEDLIEEIVGPIRDEYDSAEQEDVQFLSDNEALLNARVPLDDVKEMLRIDFPEADVDSIGGYVYQRLGEIPKAGATVKMADATLVVEAVRRHGIQAVRLVSPRPLFGDRPGRREEGSDATAISGEASRSASEGADHLG